MLSTSAALSRQGFVRCPGFAKLFQSRTSFRRLDYVAHVELVCNACDLLKYGNKWEIMRVFVSTTILCTWPTFATSNELEASTALLLCVSAFKLLDPSSGQIMDSHEQHFYLLWLIELCSLPSASGRMIERCDQSIACGWAWKLLAGSMPGSQTLSSSLDESSA